MKVMFHLAQILTVEAPGGLRPALETAAKRAHKKRIWCCCGDPTHLRQPSSFCPQGAGLRGLPRKGALSTLAKWPRGHFSDGLSLNNLNKFEKPGRIIN